MKYALFIMLLFSACRNAKVQTKIFKIDTSKLLLSEEIIFDDTIQTKDTSSIIKYTYNRNNQLSQMIIEHKTTDTHSKSFKYYYDKNYNLILKIDSGSNKIKKIEYHYLNGILSYSNYVDSTPHYLDYTISHNKLIKFFSPSDSSTCSFFYKDNNCIRSVIKTKNRTITNNYTFGKCRSPEYGQNRFVGADYSDNEVLQTNMHSSTNYNSYEIHTYVYNNYNYPIKDINKYYVRGQLHGPPFVTYYKYIPAYK